MVSKTRREFIRDTANTFGAAAALSAMPPGIRNAFAMPANNRTGTINDVEHIVVFMQENRSFDHYFGSLSGVRGFSDPRAVRQANGRSMWYQPANNDLGYTLPFHPEGANLGMEFLQGLPHDWGTTHGAWNKGKYNNWIEAKGEATMSYLTRDDIPFHFKLADAFTICDSYFCSGLLSTDPNRYYLWSGWAGNDGKGGGPVLGNQEAGYDWMTFPERLEAAGVSWKIYQDIGTGLDADGHWGWLGHQRYIGNYGCNSLLYFNQYRNASPGNPLYDKARVGSNVLAGDEYLADLRRDVENNELPQVSYIVSPEAFCEHPVWPTNYGAWYIDQVLQALTANPEVWSKTALLINYDENDGYFDHMVPPYASGAGLPGQSTVSTEYEHFTGNTDYEAGPYGLGPRVPMIVVSPWSKGGWVNSQVFDHTSVIRFIEKRFGGNNGLSEPNITPWRRAVCGDLTSAFNFKTPNDDFPTLPDTEAYQPPTHNQDPSAVELNAPADPKMPSQERGRRRARALPYEAQVSIEPSERASGMDIRFTNSGRAGMHFLVYTDGADQSPSSYTVEAGKSLGDTLDVAGSSRYGFTVHGPNGFLRQFAGDAAAREEVLRIEERYDRRAEALELYIANPSRRRCEVVIEDAYRRHPTMYRRLRPRGWTAVRVPLHHSQGWYDVSVMNVHDDSFKHRLAGHLENGRDSWSDPKLDEHPHDSWPGHGRHQRDRHHHHHHHADESGLKVRETEDGHGGHRYSIRNQ